MFQDSMIILIFTIRLIKTTKSNQNNHLKCEKCMTKTVAERLKPARLTAKYRKGVSSGVSRRSDISRFVRFKIVQQLRYPENYSSRTTRLVWTLFSTIVYPFSVLV